MNQPLAPDLRGRALQRPAGPIALASLLASLTPRVREAKKGRHSVCLFPSRARPLDQNRSVKWQDAARHKTSQSCVAGEFFMPLVVTKLAGHIVNGDHLLLGLEKSPLRLAHDRMPQESKGGSNFFWNTLRLQQLLLKSGQLRSVWSGCLGRALSWACPKKLRNILSAWLSLFL